MCSVVQARFVVIFEHFRGAENSRNMVRKNMSKKLHEIKRTFAKTAYEKARSVMRNLPVWEPTVAVGKFVVDLTIVMANRSKNEQA